MCVYLYSYLLINFTVFTGQHIIMVLRNIFSNLFFFIDQIDKDDR